MGKIKTLLSEAKETVTIIFDRGKFSVLGGSGSLNKKSEDEISKMFSDIPLSSPDVKNAKDIKEIIKFIKSSDDSQADLSIDSKDVKKLGLK